MYIIPSIHIYKGKAVKLHKGDFEQASFYDKSPLEIFLQYEKESMKRVFVVDLDGVRQKRVVNEQVLENVRAYTQLRLDYSGGVRTGGMLQNALSYGASTVTISTVAVTDPELFQSWCVSFGFKKIVLACDYHDEVIVTHGWTKKAEVSIWEHLDYYYERGIVNVKLSDVLREGGLQGPGFKTIEQVVKRYPKMQFFVAGGISSIDDVKQLNDMGVTGCIIGKSFHNGQLKFEDVLPYMVD